MYAISASSSSGALGPRFSCGAADHYATTQTPYLHPLQKLVLLWEKINFLGAIENCSPHLEKVLMHMTNLKHMDNPIKISGATYAL